MPTILLTNDDGVHSAGIRAALRALKDVGDVVVVAPAIQRSGFGRSISIFEPLRMSEVALEDGTIAYAVGGTPADCVILGIFSLLKRLPDLVVSGINVGENISTDSAMTTSKVSSSKGRSCASATRNSIMSSSPVRLSLWFDLMIIFSTRSTPTTRQPYFFAR